MNSTSAALPKHFGTVNPRKNSLSCLVLKKLANKFGPKFLPTPTPLPRPLSECLFMKLDKKAKNSGGIKHPDRMAVGGGQKGAQKARFYRSV